MTSEKPTLESVMPLVRGMAGRYHRQLGSSVDFDDLVQVGSMGALLALERFDPELGSFAPYAALWIRREICAYAADHSSTVRLPRHLTESARKAGVRARQARLSLDTPRYSDDPDSPNWVEFVVAETEEASPALTGSIVAAIDQLSPRLRKVLLGRYFGGRDRASQAKELGLVRQRVQQLEAKALELLRRIIKREAGRELARSRELARGGERP